MKKQNIKKPSINFIPIGVNRKICHFNLSNTIIESIDEADEKINDGDILVVSSKFVSMSKGRMVNLNEVIVSKSAERLAEKLKMDSRVAQLVLLESDRILGGVPGFALAIKDGVIAPNAGIDKSNTPAGYVMLYPTDPFRDAEEIKRNVIERLGKRIGVILTDSRLMPLRIGTTGIALSVAGFEPLKDERGRIDIFGNVLKVTRGALADQIAAGAQIVMGEADECFPIVLVRASNILSWNLTDNSFDSTSLNVDFDDCIYMQGIDRKEFEY